MSAPAQDMGQCVLLVDDDRMLADGIAAALERDGRTFVVCSDIESAEMALSRFPVTHLVSDVQFSGSFGFEGLHFLGRTHEGRAPHRMILMSGSMSDALRNAATALGADAVLEKPFAMSELEAALNGDASQDSSSPARTIRVSSMEDILQSDSVTTVFQPIVQLLSGSDGPFAFEALLRPRQPWALGATDAVFEYASKRSMLGQLNQHATRSAVESSMELSGDLPLFINVDPCAFDRAFVDRLCATSGRYALPLERIVLELTERSSFPDEAAATLLFEELREKGVRFALDDHGSAYSHLGMIRGIKPSFVKISSAFGIGFERDSIKQRIVHSISRLAQDLGARAILEGIETAETAEMARQMDVPLGQGYFFGRPRAAARWSEAFAHAAA